MAYMPNAPLFENPATRRLIIAIVMGVLLVAAMTAAKLVTGASIGL